FCSNAGSTARPLFSANRTSEASNINAPRSQQAPQTEGVHEGLPPAERPRRTVALGASSESRSRRTSNQAVVGLSPTRDQPWHFRSKAAPQQQTHGSQGRVGGNTAPSPGGAQ